ncbi:MAG: hypothetical protein OZSIB_3369 [Candidatus Ozemobacter sibiricus]|uniref:Uncharacterized protein n=1 Tax=Candidatus Ozemobacter sibiricus TaxID=2268124 RepID=A0A367ZQS0_9BACT|nr:MAG: hypothetical protein OZSIB_3369 [Candidatus Ozemobacter sibiricus]
MGGLGFGAHRYPSRVHGRFSRPGGSIWGAGTAAPDQGRRVAAPGVALLWEVATAGLGMGGSDW